MYLPKHFFSADENKIRKLIEENPFATVISFQENCRPFINHIPVIYSSNKGEEDILIGHMSKRNPQWLHFVKNPNCTIIINGAHTYISPTWYRSGRDVPTWNYAVAHLHGNITIIDSFSEQVEILKQLTAQFETQRSNPWFFSLPGDLRNEESLTAAIVSFKFKIDSIESKFKLSQNRSKEDQEGIKEGLLSNEDEMSRKIREMMMEHE